MTLAEADETKRFGLPSEAGIVLFNGSCVDLETVFELLRTASDYGFAVQRRRE
jgi:hypothetical protein